MPLCRVSGLCMAICGRCALRAACGGSGACMVYAAVAVCAVCMAFVWLSGGRVCGVYVPVLPVLL